MITKQGLIGAIEAANTKALIKTHTEDQGSWEVLNCFAEALMVEIAKLPEAGDEEESCPKCGKGNIQSAPTSGNLNAVICVNCGHAWSEV